MDKLKAFAAARPKLAAWIVLAIGMVIILIIAARDVGLTAGQWAFLIAATIGLAGLCVWIIGWESGEDEPGDAASPTKIADPVTKPPSASPATAQQQATAEK